MSGVHSLSDLLDRCYVDKETGCWHWRAATDNAGSPKLWSPTLRRCVSLGVAISIIKTGFPPEPGVNWRVTCNTKNCANPDHRAPGTRSQQMKDAKIQRDSIFKAKVAATKRAESSLSQEQVDEIRASKQPLTELAFQYRISRSYASKLRMGVYRGPILADSASIFTWRP